MRRIQTDLWRTRTENPAPGLYTHAFLLTRAAGNVLFYNTGHDDQIDEMAALGGVAYQFLSHEDELGEGLNRIAARYGAELGGHVREQEAFARVRPPTILFERREFLLDNIEVIPTPGHTAGSTSFFVRSAHGRRYLFTGDALYFTSRGTLEAAFFAGHSDLDAYVDSLETLRELDPDVVLSSATGGHDGYEELTPATWRRYVDRALQRLLNGHANLG